MCQVQKKRSRKRTALLITILGLVAFVVAALSGLGVLAVMGLL